MSRAAAARRPTAERSYEQATVTRGRLFVGTSGFAYKDWTPLFYPADVRADGLLEHYSSRLNTVELNNTFYRQPRPDHVAAWLAATPESFRFIVKAQRGGSIRAFGSAATKAVAAESVAWLTGPYRMFGERLGGVLYRLPDSVHRNDKRLAALLEAWPADIPLVAEFQHDSWQADEVLDLLRAHNAALCATDLDEQAAPDLRLTGRFIYLRLRRTDYTDSELDAWANRLLAFLESGTDCYVFLRHDERGVSALRALRLRELLA
jgi:uncharacterized protein YecE (DUF72 family)